MSQPKNVIICEDHQIVTDGLKSIINSFSDFRVTETVANYGQLQIALVENVPDILLLDLNLPDKNGIEILEEPFIKSLTFKVIVLTMYNKKSIIKKVVNVGAHGFLLKNCSSEDLLVALQHVTSSTGFYYGQGVKKIKRQHEHSLENDGFYKRLQLTARELEIVRCLCDGKKVPDIAESMFISPLTVETHKKNIYKKLGVHSTAKLVSFAHENQLV